MAYITGSKEFWSLELQVSPATLVPRPETELLVDYALREIPRNADWPILDLGTGSGAIALAIARERPGCFVTAVDASADALAVAKNNAQALGLANVLCIEGDWTAPVADQKFRVIVSNPPYVAEGDAALEALAAEPDVALTSGADGLDAIRQLAHECAESSPTMDCCCWNTVTTSGTPWPRFWPNMDGVTSPALTITLATHE